MTITESVTLTQDLTCSGTALYVGNRDSNPPSPITVDLGGHTVSSNFDNPTPDPEAPNSSTIQLLVAGVLQNGRVTRSGAPGYGISQHRGVEQDLVIDAGIVWTRNASTVQNSTFVNGASLQGDDNELTAENNNFVDGPPDGTAISGNHVGGWIRGNTITGYGTAFRSTTEYTLHIENNVIRNGGISVTAFGGGDVSGNNITSAPGNGITITGRASYSVNNNVVVSSGGDGIQVAPNGSSIPIVTIGGNLAVSNSQLGINSEFGVNASDGGGNVASGNGDPVQCAGVACAPSGVALTVSSSNPTVVCSPESCGRLMPGASTPVTLTATSSFDVGPTPWAIDIVDTATNKVLAYCGVGTTCATTVAKPASTHVYQAIIAKPTGAKVQFQSTPVTVSWYPSTVALQASTTTASPGYPVTLTATANEDVGPTNYAIVIVDVTANKVIASCGIGWNCSVTVAKSAGSRTYVAEIAKPNGSQVQATSPPVIVTWQ